MLSVLIPTYNYNTFPLVNELYKQATSANIEYEIIVLDDGSRLFHGENGLINDLSNCSYTVLDRNIGRSSIRNHLARQAKYNWLLFLDSDVMPKNPDFISNYIPQLTDQAKIINGGILYQEQKPEKDRMFRWVYGTKRESQPVDIRDRDPYHSFLTLNFLIHKSVFSKVSFNETIPNLRHEDTLFSYDLMLNKIPVVNIDNPVYHLGIDTFETAIRKENESMIALKHLMDNRLMDPAFVKIARVLTLIRKLKLVWVFSLLYQMLKKPLLSNLSSNNPSLRAFDMYRVLYYCTLDK